MNSYQIDVEEYKPESCKELYSNLNTHQITALMFHDEMTDLFDFLGLEGFKQMHEYQYLSESINHRALKKYYMNQYGMLLPDDQIDSIDVIPSDWYQHNRMAVTPGVRRQAVQRAMEQYKDWESYTKDLYQKCASHLLNWGKISDFNEINCYIKDVDEELKNLESLCVELKAVGYEDTYMVSMQDCYKHKYGELLKNIGSEI